MRMQTGILLLVGSGVWTHLKNVQQADQRSHELLMDSLGQVKTNLEGHLNQLELAFTSSLNNYQATISRYNDLQKQLRFSASRCYWPAGANHW